MRRNPVSSAALMVGGPTQTQRGYEGPMRQTRHPQPRGREGAPMGTPVHHRPHHLGEQRRGGRAGLAPIPCEYYRRMPPSRQGVGGGSQPSGYQYSRAATAPQMTAAPGGFSSRYPHQQRRPPALYEQQLSSQQIIMRAYIMPQQMHSPRRVSAFSLGEQCHVHCHHCHQQMAAAYRELQQAGEREGEPARMMTSSFPRQVTLVPRHRALLPLQQLGLPLTCHNCERGSACPLPGRPNGDHRTVMTANQIRSARVPPIRAATVSGPVPPTRRPSGRGVDSFRDSITFSPLV